MSEYPDDIMRLASKYTARCYQPKTGTWFDVRDVIASAISEERERCVSFCRAIAKDSREEAIARASERRFGTANHWNAHADGCDECIDAILHTEPLPAPPIPHNPTVED